MVCFVCLSVLSQSNCVYIYVYIQFYYYCYYYLYLEITISMRIVFILDKKDRIRWASEGGCSEQEAKLLPEIIQSIDSTQNH
jgi:hypothetical protein